MSRIIFYITLYVVYVSYGAVAQEQFESLDRAEVLSNLRIEEIPQEYQIIIRDLVDKYELLRNSIGKEADAIRSDHGLVMEGKNTTIAVLETELAAAKMRIEELESELLVSQEISRKNIQLLSTKINKRYAKDLLTLGAVASLDGDYGYAAHIAIPATRIQFLHYGTYGIREKRFTFFAGIGISFLSHALFVRNQ